MKKSSFFIIFILLNSIFLIANDNIKKYAHISFLENHVKVIKTTENSVVKGMLNLPIVSGDIIKTKNDSRCEIQFYNGTIIRLDNNTTLKIISISADSITSKFNLTTLRLLKGSLYSVSQDYNLEIYQIKTDNFSVKLTNRSKIYMTTDKIYSLQGKVNIAFIDKYNKENKLTLKSKKGILIKNNKAEHFKVSKNNEFLNWNKTINSNFKKLHYGKSKLPGVIYRYSKGIVWFAKNFSNKFGKWVYNEYLGYVWQPSDERFKEYRPFYDANYVRINGKLYLVPNQPWGWIPSKLGTWFWSKKNGWVWIPGDAFSRGIMEKGLINDYELYYHDFYSFSYYAFGNIDLMLTYLKQGKKVWENRYKAYFKKEPPKLSEKINPFYKTLLNRIKKADKIFIKNSLRSPYKINKSIITAKIRESYLYEKLSVKPETEYIGKLDWSPDKLLVKKLGVNIKYSEKRNSIICKKLNLDSSKLTTPVRVYIRKTLTNNKLNMELKKALSTGGSISVENSISTTSLRTNTNLSTLKGSGHSTTSEFNNSSSEKSKKK